MSFIEINWPTSKYSSRNGHAITAIIIHDTAGLMDGCLTWLVEPPPKGSPEASAHVLITRDGTIYRMVEDNLKAWTNGASALHGEYDCNFFSLGIELERDTLDYTGAYPDKQIQVAAEWVADKCIEYGIPLNRVVGHRDVSPNRKIDPRNFPWETFLLRVAQSILGVKI